MKKLLVVSLAGLLTVSFSQPLDVFLKKNTSGHQLVDASKVYDIAQTFKAASNSRIKALEEYHTAKIALDKIEDEAAIGSSDVEKGRIETRLTIAKQQLDAAKRQVEQTEQDFLRAQDDAFTAVADIDGCSETGKKIKVKPNGVNLPKLIGQIKRTQADHKRALDEKHETYEQERNILKSRTILDRVKGELVGLALTNPALYEALMKDANKLRPARPWYQKMFSSSATTTAENTQEKAANSAPNGKDATANSESSEAAQAAPSTWEKCTNYIRSYIYPGNQVPLPVADSLQSTQKN